MPYDAILVLSFGGPESKEDVIPFLENVLRGRNVPRERMLEVAEHYYHFGGRSPINDQNRALVAGLRNELAAHGPDLPVYWGNRNWHPLLPDTLARMRDDGVRRALAFVTSAYSSYSSCRQYLKDIDRAREQVGEGAPEVHKVRVFYNHPLFIEVMASNLYQAVAGLPENLRDEAMVLFTAHSIPLSMASNSAYQQQIEEASRLVAEGAGRRSWKVVYQSRSGPPSQPWLEPDVCDVLHESDARAVVIVPIGFTSDHMEVLYDLDEEARGVCEERGIAVQRAATAGADPRFIRMIRELIVERMEDRPVRPALGELGPGPDRCADGCCPSSRRSLKFLKASET